MSVVSGCDVAVAPPGAVPVATAELWIGVPASTSGRSRMKDPAAPSGVRWLVFFAVREEASPLERLLGACPSSIRVRTTGMGHANAGRCVVQELQATTPAAILTCGFAGGLDPALPHGQVVFDADPGLGIVETLAARGAVPVRFVHTDRILITAREKADLRGRTGADAVDMESAVIRERARAAGVPSATIRVVSDAAGEELPLDFNELMTPDMRLHYPSLIGQLMVSPGRIPCLMGFGRRTALAARALASVVKAVFDRPPPFSGV